MHKPLKHLINQHLKSEEEVERFEALLADVSDLFETQEQQRLELEKSLQMAEEDLLDNLKTMRELRKKNEADKAQLERNFAKQKALFNTTPEAIFSFNPGGRLAEINATGLALFGRSEQEVFSNSSEQNLEIWLDKMVEPEPFRKKITKIKEHIYIKLHGYAEFKDGRYFEYYSLPEEHNGDYFGRVWCWRDVTEIRDQQRLLKHQAFHDSLTGLPNRLYLLESLSHAIEYAKENHGRVVVMFIDLDDFKKINDAAGHHEGDQCLIEIAKRLKKLINSGDVVGRLGGDEFLLILRHIRHQRELEEFKRRITEVLARPFNKGAHDYRLSYSFGISLYPNDGKKSEELLRKAGMAMYKAKKSGKGKFRYFDPSLERVAMHRLRMESRLREALENNEFSLVYQPKYDLVNKLISGVEVLIRWPQANGQVLTPDQFIPMAETCGLIQPITRWLLKSVCEKLSEWRGTEFGHLVLAMNVSALDFEQKEFWRLISSEVARHEFNPNLLEIEITESVFLDEKDKAHDVIRKLNTLGLKVSIDDFGTGYSNFSYLQELNVDVLKIDRTFIERATSDPRSAAIVKSIVDIGRHLDLEVVAEGVEDQQTLDFVIDAGCHFCQGFFISEPLEEAQLKKELTENFRSSSHFQLPLLRVH